MQLLRMREACFHGSGISVGPVTIDVYPGERVARVLPGANDAGALALIAAGVVKASSGEVLIEAYDPRVQPAHCKRIAGFVPHDPLPFAPSNFEHYISYRAALWSVDPKRALAQAHDLLHALSDVHEAFSFPLIGALIADPQFLVLDRPQPAYAQSMLAAIGSRAIFSTHVSDAAARAFA